VPCGYVYVDGSSVGEITDAHLLVACLSAGGCLVLTNPLPHHAGGACHATRAG